MNSDSTYVEEADDESASPEAQLPSSPPLTTKLEPNNATESALDASTSFRVIPSLSDNPFAQGEEGRTYFTRPNRYFGPASTWKSWTKEERTLALSLDRVRSQDLGIHLLSAFGLKRKAMGLLPETKPKRSKKGKERASSVLSAPGEDAENLLPRGNKPVLSKSWTAWPLPPDQVPRDELLPRTEEAGEIRAKIDSRPSADLEEWLVATAMRLARERWDSRQWEDAEGPGDLSQREVKAGLADVEMSAAQRDDEDSRNQEDTEEEEEGEEQGDGVARPDPDDLPVFASQPFTFSDDEENDDDGDDQVSTPMKTKVDDEESDPDRRPVPLADDDTARRYILPSARHILSKLDDLLLGLHRARYVYAGKPARRQRSKYSETSEEITAKQGNERSQSRPMPGKRERSSSANSDFSSASTASTSYSKRSRRVEKLGLRDWSDVIGVASLTGWDSAVVERASERCAELFDENMLFRTFHEGDAKEGTDAYYTEHLAFDTESSAASPGGDVIATVDEGATQVIRTSSPCESCQAAQAQCLPADAVSGVSRPCKRCSEMGFECSTIRVDDNTSHGQTCPHEHCPRHTIPFRKQYRLQRHLDTVHGHGESLARRREKPIYSRSTSVGFSDTDIAREANEITCPVLRCRRNIKGFSSGRRMYAHLRRMHPDVDVQEVKKMEVRRRGERRGRWRDERRKRSKSVSRSMSRRRGRDVPKMEIENDEEVDVDDPVYVESGSEEA